MPRVDAGRPSRARRRSSVAAAPNFPRAVPTRPGQITRPVWHPSRTQLHAVRAQARSYRSQAGAVRRAAVVQQRLGPGFAVRPPRHGQVLRARDITRYQRRPTTQARLAERQYGSQGQAVKRAAAQQRAKALKGAKAIYLTDPKELRAAGFKTAGIGEGIASSPKYILKALSNVPKDVAETAVGIPTSVAHIAVKSTQGAIKSAKTGSPVPFLKAEAGLGKELVKPYGELYHHPLKFATEHPVTTALMLDPFVKVPGRAAGRLARATGRQTLERPRATMPGTTLIEHRPGSRSYGKRQRQQRADVGTPGSTSPLAPPHMRRARPAVIPRVSAKELRRRVDEHHDKAQHDMQEAVTEALHRSHEATRGQPRDVRLQHAADAVEAAKAQARTAADASFAREFGANLEPEVGAATVQAAKANREAAAGEQAAAKRSRRAAKRAHEQALTNARTARGRTPVRPDVSALHAERRTALTELVDAQRAVGAAERGFQQAHAGARVSVARPKSSPLLRELHGQRRAVQRKAAKGEQLPSREQFIAERPKAHAADTPSVSGLTQNLKPGRPGLSIENEFRRQTYRGGKFAGWGEPLPGSKVVVARNAQGEPIGALHVLLDAEGKPTQLSVAVDPAHQGAGVGTSLYRYAQEHGLDVESASGKGGLTAAGAGLQHKRLVARQGPTVESARKAVSVADRDVVKVQRAVQRAEEEGSRRAGITEGRHAAGRMTMVAGRRAADQAEHIANLRGALHEVEQTAAKAREQLKQAERRARQGARGATRAIDKLISAERQRIAGVAPAEHETLLNALTARETAPARVRAARQRVRGVDTQIAAKHAAERERVAGVPPAQADALLRSIHQLDDAQVRHAAARDTHAVARQAHIAAKQAHNASALVNPAAEGRLFDNPRDAKTVVRQLNAQAHEIPTGSRVPVDLRVREPGAVGRPVTATRRSGVQPLRFKVKQVGEDRWAALPTIASQRMYGGGGKAAELSHASVGTSKATGAKIMRTSRRAFTQATLPLSLKWLAGQGVEAVIRAVVEGAGPADLVRFNRIVKRMNHDVPGSGDAFAKRIRGGQLGKTGAIAEQLRGSGKTLGEEFQGTPLSAPAALTTLVGDTAAIRGVRHGFGAYTKNVIGAVNQFFENTARKAMAGHTIRHGEFMEGRLHGLTDKAIQDAADGLQNTPAQVQASRALHSQYGKYSQWSPEMRSLLLHWTPFLPWYLNTARFLAWHLPVNHPLKSALLADANQAEQDWRKSEHLSFYDRNHRPSFLMGGYPSKGGGVLRIAHYTPWGAGPDVGSAIADLILPQVLGPVKNLAGVDWKWKQLTNPDRTPFTIGEKAARAATTIAESQIPALSQIGQLTGLTAKYIDRKQDVGTLGSRAKKLLPTTPTAPTPPKKRRKKSPAGFGGGGFGSSGAGF